MGIYHNLLHANAKYQFGVPSLFVFLSFNLGCLLTRNSSCIYWRSTYSRQIRARVLYDNIDLGFRHVFNLFSFLSTEKHWINPKSVGAIFPNRSFNRGLWDNLLIHIDLNKNPKD